MFTAFRCYELGCSNSIYENFELYSVKITTDNIIPGRDTIPAILLNIMTGSDQGIYVRVNGTFIWYFLPILLQHTHDIF